MSKPSICPVTGLRAPSSRVSAETPAMSRPRFWMVSMCCRPASAGRRHRGGGAYDCRQLVVTTSVPDGAGEGVWSRWGTVRGRGGRRRVQGRRVVGAGRVQAPVTRVAASARDDRERAGRRRLIGTPPAASRRPTRRTGPRPPRPAARARRRTAATRRCRRAAARSGRSARTAARRRLVSNAAKVALPVRPLARGQRDRALPVAGVVERADLLVDRGVVGPRQRVAGRRMPGSAPSSVSSAVDRRGRGLPGLLERRARAAGDEGQALVRLRVEPGDPRLGRGEGGGVDAVAGGVDVCP